MDDKGKLHNYKMDSRLCHFSCNGLCSRARDPFSCQECAHGYSPVKIDKLDWGKYFINFEAKETLGTLDVSRIQSEKFICVPICQNNTKYDPKT